MRRIVCLLTVMFGMVSCSEESLPEIKEGQSSDEVIHQQLTFKELSLKMSENPMVFTDEFKSVVIENYELSVSYVLKNLSETENNTEPPVIDYFFDPVHNNETYSFVTHPYAGHGDYLEKFVITIEDGEQKVGYLRYYPAEDIYAELFTGTIEVMSLNRIDKNESYIENGITITNQTNAVIEDCITVFNIKSTRCTHGGNHRFGQQCGPGFVNDAYLYVATYTTCTRTITSDIVEMPAFIMDINPNRGGGGGGSGYNSQAQQNNFLNALPYDLQEWLDENLKIKGIVLSYLNSNQYSNENKAVANQLIAFVENDEVLSTLNNLLTEFVVNQALYSTKFDAADVINFWDNLTLTEKMILQNYADNGISANGYFLKPSVANFFLWAFPYLIDNPTITVEQFENWFMMESEGKDFFYDANYWENPNLTFQQQSLPTWVAFSAAYPNETSAQLYGVVGGAVAQAQIDHPIETQNGCALKVSRALNYSGITIPNIPSTSGNPGTLQGADGKYYFLNAKSLNIWMRKTFGVSPTNSKHHHFTAQDGGNKGEDFPDLVKNKKGIFSMVSNNTKWAYGHADILRLDGSCKAGCYFNGPVEYIDVWVLD